MESPVKMMKWFQEHAVTIDKARQMKDEERENKVSRGTILLHGRIWCESGSERMGNSIIPYGSKLLRRLLRRDSIKKSKGASDFSEPLLNDCLYPD
jgi:hypothetical protein